MKWVLLLALVFSLNVSSEENYPILDQLEGNWTGKWDEKYSVKFEISRNGQVFDIKYFIEENIGEPYKELKVQGKPLNGNSVMAGTLLFVVSMVAENKVTVIGIFDPGTRISNLTKQK